VSLLALLSGSSVETEIVVPGGLVTPAGWVRQLDYQIPDPTGTGVRHSVVTSAAQMDTAIANYGPGDVIPVQAGLNLGNYVGFHGSNGTWGRNGTAANKVIFYSTDGANKVKVDASGNEAVHTRPGVQDYHEWWGFDFKSNGTGVLFGGHHNFARWCRIESTSTASSAAIRFLGEHAQDPAIKTTPYPDVIGGGVLDSVVKHAKHYRAEGLYVGWGADPELQRCDGQTSQRNYFIDCGGGAHDIKANTKNFSSIDDVFYCVDNISGVLNIMSGWTDSGFSDYSDPNCTWLRPRIYCYALGDSSGFNTDGDAIRWSGTATVDGAIVFNTVAKAAIFFIQSNSSTVATLTNSILYGNPQNVRGSSPFTLNGSGNRWDGTAGDLAGTGTGGLTVADFVATPDGDTEIRPTETGSVGDGLGTNLQLVGKAPHTT